MLAGPGQVKLMVSSTAAPLQPRPIRKFSLLEWSRTSRIPSCCRAFSHQLTTDPHIGKPSSLSLPGHRSVFVPRARLLQPNLRAQKVPFTSPLFLASAAAILTLSTLLSGSPVLRDDKGLGLAGSVSRTCFPTPCLVSQACYRVMGAVPWSATWHHS